MAIRYCSFVVGLASGFLLLPHDGLAQAKPAPAAARPAPVATRPAAAPGRIAYVDWQGLLRQIPAYAQADSIYLRISAPYQREIARVQAAFDSASADLDSSADKLSPQDQAARRKALAAKRDSVDQRVNLFRNDVAAMQQVLLAPLEERARAALEAVRAEGRFGLVIDVSTTGHGIVAADSALNLTVRVLRRLSSNQ